VENSKDKFYLILFLGFILLLDLFVIGGILYKGHANFAELIKNLKK
jgi:hypothetical protein